MLKTLAATAVAGVVLLAAAPAGATNWNENMDLCATAVEAEGLAVISDHNVKFAGGTARKLLIKLTPKAGGDSLVAECKIRRGEVTEVSIKA